MKMQMFAEQDWDRTVVTKMPAPKQGTILPDSNNIRI
jgi:hypothetical protein